MARVSSLAAFSSLPSRCSETALDRVRLTFFCCLGSLIAVTPTGRASESVLVMNSMFDSSRSRPAAVAVVALGDSHQLRRQKSALPNEATHACRGWGREFGDARARR